MIALCLDFRLAQRKATGRDVAKAARVMFDAQDIPEENETSWRVYDQAHDALMSGDVDAWKAHGGKDFLSRLGRHGRAEHTEGDKDFLALVGRHGRAIVRTVPCGKDIADMLGWNRQRARRACIQIRALPRGVLLDFFDAMGWQDRGDVPRMLRVRGVRLSRVKAEPCDENDIASILAEDADRKPRGADSAKNAP
jgi:hypothetical protein